MTDTMPEPANEGQHPDPTAFDGVIAWAGAALPEPVAQKARLLLLDSIGCIAAGLRHAEVQDFAARLAIWFPGDVLLPGAATPLGPAGAAALGAAAMCWDEANEGLAVAHGRPALPLVPALLAIAGSGGAGQHSLGQLLHALAVGYEVGGRAGEMWRIRPGMHVDGSSHALGAAAGCAWLMGADAALAVRLAACQIPFSLYRPIAFGMTGRNTYPAHAALLGIRAASAAAAGIAAPAGGFAEARMLALGHARPPVATPSGVWLLKAAYLKPFAAVRHAHYAAAAAIAARAEVADTRAITAIRLETYAEALRYAGNRAPAAAIAAQFSLSFAVAAALRWGALDPAVYRRMDDAEVVRLEALVELAEDTAMTAAGQRAARLIVGTAEGTLRREIDSVPGDPARPMTEAEARAKFLRLADALPEAVALADAVLHGDAAAPLHRW
jgi:2-methylcitrate dehydratase PrpD